MDFSDAQRMRDETDPDIYADIRGGVLDSPMPPWEKVLSPRQTKDVIAWIRVLAKAEKKSAVKKKAP